MPVKRGCISNKGQATMEFLMTYGWAILAAIIAIGVLASFGIFSPGGYAPTGSVINPPYYIKGAAVNTTTVQVELQNSGGEDVSVTSITISGCGALTGLLVDIVAGESRVFDVPCTTPLDSVKILKGDIIVTYKKGSGLLELQSAGTISEKIIIQ